MHSKYYIIAYRIVLYCIISTLNYIIVYWCLQKDKLLYGRFLCQDLSFEGLASGQVHADVNNGTPKTLSPLDVLRRRHPFWRFPLCEPLPRNPAAEPALSPPDLALQEHIFLRAFFSRGVLLQRSGHPIHMERIYITKNPGSRNVGTSLGLRKITPRK